MNNSLKEKTTAIVNNNKQMSANNVIIAENQQKIYNKAWRDGNGEGYITGKEQGYNEGYSQSELDFWNDIVYWRNEKNRSSCEYLFHRWRCEYIRPPRKLTFSTRNISMFSLNTYLKKIEKAYFDISAFTPNVQANMTDSNYSTFYYCQALEEIEDIGMQGGGYYYTYNNCSNLHTIEVMRCVAKGTYKGPFTNCSALKNITIEGEIGTNFPISYSPLLSQDSINSIIDHLVDLTGQTAQTVSFHSTVTNNLTEEQLTKITSKNWTID